MAETIVVIALIIAALSLLGGAAYRTLSGKSGCCSGGCTDCTCKNTEGCEGR